MPRHARAADAHEMDVPDLVLHRGDAHATLGDDARRVGLAERARLARHVEQPRLDPGRWIICGELLRREVALLDQDRRAALGQEARVRRLVVVDRVRERHQDARHAAGGELGDGDGAGAADHQVGLGVAARHVVDERDQLALHAGVAVVLACSASRCFSPAWWTTVRPVTASSASAFGTASFSACAPRLPPTTRIAQRPLPAGEALLGRRDRGDVGAHRVAGPLARPSSACGNARHHLVADLREHAVGEPGDRVLLVQRERPVPERRHHAAGKRDVAAQAEHHVGPEPADVARAFPEANRAGSRGSSSFCTRPLPRAALARIQAAR